MQHRVMRINEIEHHYKYTDAVWWSIKRKWLIRDVFEDAVGNKVYLEVGWQDYIKP